MSASSEPVVDRHYVDDGRARLSPPSVLEHLPIRMYDGSAAEPRRPVRFSLTEKFPGDEKLAAADVVRLDTRHWDEFPRLRRAVTTVYRAAGRPIPRIVLLMNICVSGSRRDALRAFDGLSGADVAQRRPALWFVGTTEGLEALISDLSALGMGDGLALRLWTGSVPG